MASPKNGTTTAPGPDVVEATANPMAAGFMRALIQEAREALEAKHQTDGTVMSPTARYGLEALTAHADQLVRATTPVPAEDGAK